MGNHSLLTRLARLEQTILGNSESGPSFWNCDGDQRTEYIWSVQRRASESLTGTDQQLVAGNRVILSAVKTELFEAL
jgi:hypothetical protein